MTVDINKRRQIMLNYKEEINFMRLLGASDEVINELSDLNNLSK